MLKELKVLWLATLITLAEMKAKIFKKKSPAKKVDTFTPITPKTKANTSQKSNYNRTRSRKPRQKQPTSKRSQRG